MSADRPAVSLSKALHCRMELYLNGHGYIPEPHQPTSLRTFDYGHLTEAALFDGIQLGEMQIGPWWPELGVIRDPTTGAELDTREWEVTDRQLEVELHGYKGHIDGLLRRREDGTTLLPDCKSASGFSFDRALKDDLFSSVFSREYVGQLHAYRSGLRTLGREISGMILVYVNKENSQVMFRHVPHLPDLDAEIEERLAWATATAEPTPDHAWTPGGKIPLRCGYCDQKVNCAALRGMNLELGYEKNRPIWKAA